MILKFIFNITVNIMFEKEKKIFNQYLKICNLKHSIQREKILNIVLAIEKHITIDELAVLVRKKNPNIGYATVYRTMKLLCEAEICKEMRLQDGLTRYEHHYGHEHHDHLVCVRCGKFIEVLDKEIEDLQKKLIKKHSFQEQHHRLEIYGTCKECHKNRNK